jgi:hypothetical protein
VPLPASVQLALAKVPFPLVVKATLLVGSVCVPVSTSLTVAVQVVDSPGAMVVGEQLTLVVVRRWVVGVGAVAVGVVVVVVVVVVGAVVVVVAVAVVVVVGGGGDAVVVVTTVVPELGAWVESPA